jgi:hypothetical protein
MHLYAKVDGFMKVKYIEEVSPGIVIDDAAFRRLITLFVA